MGAAYQYARLNSIAGAVLSLHNSTVQQRHREMAGKVEENNSEHAWYVYIIEASDGSLYTGVTTDVTRRFKEHQGTARAAKYFRGRQALRVVYSETHQDRSSALQREAAIKQLPRAGKLELIRRDTFKSGLGAPVDI